MTLSLIEMHKLKRDQEATYIELDTTPTIVQSMSTIERSMQAAVDRLRSIRKKKDVS